MAFLYKNWTEDVIPGTATWQAVALLNGQLLRSPPFNDQTSMNTWIDQFPQPVTQYVAPGAMPAAPMTTPLTSLQQQQYQQQQLVLQQQQQLQSQQALQLQAAQQRLAMQQAMMRQTQQQPTQTDASKQASPPAEKPFYRQPLVIAAALSVLGGLAIAWMRKKKRA